MDGHARDGRRPGFLRGQPGKFLCAGRGQRQASLEYPARKFGARKPDHVCGRREAVRGGRGGQRGVGFQPALEANVVAGYFSDFLCASLRTSSTSRRESKLDTVRVAEVISPLSACTS